MDKLFKLLKTLAIEHFRHRHKAESLAGPILCLYLIQALSGVDQGSGEMPSGFSAFWGPAEYLTEFGTRAMKWAFCAISSLFDFFQ